MYVKKVRRKCGVRGCKNIDTYTLSLSRESGNSVIICKSCLGKALGAIDEAVEEKSTLVSHTEAPALFFNSRIGSKLADAVETGELASGDEEELKKLVNEVAENSEPAEPEPAEEYASEPAEPEPAEEDDELVYVCPYCDLICKTEQGLQRHIEAKHKDRA